MVVTRRPGWAFSLETARQNLLKHFHTNNLEGFGFANDPGDDQALRAAGGVIDYLNETQKTSLEHVDRLQSYRSSTALEIDEASRRSLEITRTIREGRREGSLLAVLDRTVTAMGARLLADWLANPLIDVPAIQARQEAVAELVADSALADHLHETLRKVYDVQRLLARVTTGRASPRDLSFLGRTLRALPGLKARLTARKSALLNQLEAEIDLCPDLRSRLDAGLADDCPLSSRDGGFIRDGYHEPLDALRELAHGGKQWIARYQAEESQRTGISTLKVGFNKVFGYYIEITNTHREKIPAEYIRKQTVKNAERYITPELKEYEEKVLTADEKSKELEYELFLELRDAVAAARRRMQATADVLAQLDVLVSLAELARQRNYCRPEVVEEPELKIIDGRHPVLDVIEPEGTFVPNDVAAGAADGTILLITGPNMAGKSTYIRQVALITLLAQIGSFVPAREARIGVADRIFARVGASDELARGQSTFMVEMTETARILNTATPRSLVILDEIGRGTSTYDGISLAWSVVEFLHEHVGCRTLFATHYHELTDLEKSLERREEPQRGRARVAGGSDLPAQDHSRRGRQELRHPRRPVGRRAARGGPAEQGDPGPVGRGASRRRGPRQDRPAATGGEEDAHPAHAFRRRRSSADRRVAEARFEQRHAAGGHAAVAEMAGGFGQGGETLASVQCLQSLNLWNVRSSDVASVPRRFGVGVLLILMTAFAVLFAAMRTFGAWPEVFVVVAVLFLGVTLGQILLFQGEKPREASIVAGGMVFPLVVFAVIVFCEELSTQPVRDIRRYSLFAHMVLLRR